VQLTLIDVDGQPRARERESKKETDRESVFASPLHPVGARDFRSLLAYSKIAFNLKRAARYSRRGMRDENKPPLFSLGARARNERKADVGKLTTRYRVDAARSRRRCRC